MNGDRVGAHDLVVDTVQRRCLNSEGPGLALGVVAGVEATAVSVHVVRSDVGVSHDPNLDMVQLMRVRLFSGDDETTRRDQFVESVLDPRVILGLADDT